jgi:hypothetical protein
VCDHKLPTVEIWSLGSGRRSRAFPHYCASLKHFDWSLTGFEEWQADCSYRNRNFPTRWQGERSQKETRGQSMYAITKSSMVYHLLYPDQSYTLCGFRAEKLDLQFSDKAALRVVEFVPPSRELCKQCDKMHKRRKVVTENWDYQSYDPEDSALRTLVKSRP